MTSRDAYLLSPESLEQMRSEINHLYGLIFEKLDPLSYRFADYKVDIKVNNHVNNGSELVIDGNTLMIEALLKGSYSSQDAHITVSLWNLEFDRDHALDRKGMPMKSINKEEHCKGLKRYTYTVTEKMESRWKGEKGQEISSEELINSWVNDLIKLAIK